MSRVAVVGSGPSGVHYARTALELGHEVIMLDVGHERPAPVLPAAGFDELKAQLDDPVTWLLGGRFEGVLWPAGGGEYYGLPPSKGFVLAPDARNAARADGFAPLFSFAQGGLAEAWTAGVYPFNDAELADFPFGYADLAPHYEEVARRIGIAGEADDLARFMPLHRHLMEPLRLDAHSALLVDRYRARAARMNAEQRCWLGRSRIATLSRAHEGREPCGYLGRCLWGCPHQALYTPSVTLAWCRAQPRFRYLPDAWVSHLALASGRARGAVVLRADGAFDEVPAEHVALCAGALSSARILLESVHRDGGGVLTLPGLMDNQQVLVPFVNAGMLGRRADPRSYQYHQVCLGFEADEPKHYLHAQLTTLKTAMAHPVIQSLPLDMRSATAVFRALRSTLGVANLNLHDTRRDDCAVTLEPGQGGRPGSLLLSYRPAAGDDRAVADATARLRRALGALGCLVPPGMSHVRPKGASVHYAGLVPMGSGTAPMRAGDDGRWDRATNVWLADGITFPFLPAKNITFTLMANAVRVARALA